MAPEGLQQGEEPPHRVVHDVREDAIPLGSKVQPVVEVRRRDHREVREEGRERVLRLRAGELAVDGLASRYLIHFASYYFILQCTSCVRVSESQISAVSTPTEARNCTVFSMALFRILEIHDPCVKRYLEPRRRRRRVELRQVDRYAQNPHLSW